MTMGPRDEFRSSYPDPTKGLRWALAVVSLIAVAAVIAAVTLWLNPRHVEQASPDAAGEKKVSTGVPRSDLEQITGQNLRLTYPGPPVRITCPDDLPARVGATEDCVLQRFGRDFKLTLTVTSVNSPTDVNWRFTLGEAMP